MVKERLGRDGGAVAVVGGGKGAAGVVIFDLIVGPRFPFLFFGGGGGMASAMEVGGGPASTMGMVTLMEVLASSSIISSSSNIFSK